MSTNPTVPVKIVESLIDHQQAMEDRIRTRAYERFIQRGQAPGGEIEDWFAASADLIQSPRITVGQTETEFVVLFSVADVNVKALELLATERAILLQSEPHPLADVPGFIHLCECLPRRVFRLIELPSSINPSARISRSSSSRVSDNGMCVGCANHTNTPHPMNR